MMRLIDRLTPFVLFTCAAGSALAQSVVGDWHGGLVVDRSTLPTPTSAEHRKFIENGLSQMAATRIELVLRANKTFMFAGENMMGVAGRRTMEGSYSKSGRSIVLHGTKQDGKNFKGRNFSFTIDNGGRSLSNVMSKSPAISMVVSR